MGKIKAEIYIHPKLKCFRARVDGIANTGHSISEESGLFTIMSIIIKDVLLCYQTSRDEAEIAIGNEWEVLVGRHKPQTSREVAETEFDDTSLEQRTARRQLRNHLADLALLPTLKPGDRLRATKAECCASEATFTFSHWDHGWIVSNSGASIAPGSVYSINGKVFRV